MKEGEHFHGDNLVEVSPITIEQLLGGVLSDQPVERLDSYVQLAQRPLRMFVIGKDRIVLSFGEIDGEQLTHLLHFAAPSKELGINYERIVKEWSELFREGANIHRLQAHRSISGWEAYEPHRAILLDAVVGAHNSVEASSPILVPVINLKLAENRKFVWDYEPLSEDVSDVITTVSPARSVTTLPILGPLVVAAYAPEITQQWAGVHGKRNYRRPVDTFGKGSRDMGSTEVLPLALGEAESLLATPLVQAVIHMASLHQTS